MRDWHTAPAQRDTLVHLVALRCFRTSVFPIVLLIPCRQREKETRHVFTCHTALLNYRLCNSCPSS